MKAARKATTLKPTLPAELGLPDSWAPSLPVLDGESFPPLELSPALPEPSVELPPSVPEPPVGLAPPDCVGVEPEPEEPEPEPEPPSLGKNFSSTHFSAGWLVS